MEGEGDDTFSNGGDTAEKDQNRTPTLDQDQEGDGKEEKAELNADSDADDTTIDPLDDESQGSENENRDLEREIDDMQKCKRRLQNKKRDLERAFDNARKRNRCLTAEVSRIEKMTKDLGRMAGYLTKHLNLSNERDKKAAKEQVQISHPWEKIVEALEANKTRLEGELDLHQSEVGEGDAAMALMANALTVSEVVAAVLWAGAFSALSAAVYFQNVKKR